MSTADKKMQQFFAGQTCLIVEPSKVFLASIQACVKSLELTSTEILVANKYEDAVHFIEKSKPQILIVEYDVEGRNGLTLVDLQRAHHKDSECVTIVVSRNSSDSVIADAAEGDVDGFLLKPFSVEDFKKKLVAVIDTKVSPSPYTQKISTGKSLLAENKYDEAVKFFREAKTADEKPSLACFYAGEVLKTQNDLSGALTEYKEGRKYQPLHYKCLIGEFEILMETKSYKEAHSLIPIIIKNYPLTSHRLVQVFIAAVFSMQFELLPAYYEQYTKLESRSPELVRIAAKALSTGARWYLQKNDLVRSVDLFDKAFKVMNRDILFLDEIVTELLNVGAIEEARQFFAKVLPGDVGGPDYSRLAFNIDLRILPKNDLLERARKFAQSGEASPEHYKVIVKMFAEEGKITFTEGIIQRAVTTFPDLKQSLYQILEEHSLKVQENPPE